MKILFANNYAYLRGGSERVLFDEIQLLEKYNVQSCFFSRQHPKNDKWPSDSSFPPHLEYEAGGILNKIASAKALIYSNTVGNALVDLIHRETPDILHAHNVYGRLTTSIFDAAILEGIPAVLTLHDYKLICPSYLLMRDDQICELCVKGSLYKCLVKRCHKGSLAASAVYTLEAYFARLLGKYDKVRYFISPSNFLLEKHIEGGIAPEKLVYIPNTIDVSDFKPSFEPGKYVLFVGRLSREKGIKTLLMSMIDLNINLEIVGDGPSRPELEKITKENGSINVSFAGYQSGEILKNLFRNAAFLVFPSEWYENAPMTILEAYGYGKPVIGSDIGGIPEMIVEGETGLLFPPGDSEALREKIELLWNQPEVICRMGKAARDRVKKKYNAPLHYEHLMDIYHKALA